MAGDAAPPRNPARYLLLRTVDVVNATPSSCITVWLGDAVSENRILERFAIDSVENNLGDGISEEAYLPGNKEPPRREENEEEATPRHSSAFPVTTSLLRPH